MCEQLVVDRLDDGARGRGGDRVPAEGRAVVARPDRAGDLVPHEQRADRETVAEALGQRDEVGLEPELLGREERPRAAEPGLHLVDPEQRTDLTRDLARRAHELLLERHHATFAEDRLDDDCRKLAARRDRALERLDVVRRRERDTGDERPEPLPLRRLARDGERAERPAVEACPRARRSARGPSPSARP